MEEGAYMKIKINVAEWLGKRKMTRNQLSVATGIRPATIANYYYETLKRIEVDHLAKICQALDCTPGDLLEVIPDSNLL